VILNLRRHVTPINDFVLKVAGTDGDGVGRVDYALRYHAGVARNAVVHKLLVGLIIEGPGLHKIFAF